MKRGDWQARIADKVWQDAEFKKRLLANPSQVVSEETGTPIPSGMTIHVLEEDAQNVYLVIPKSPGRAEALSDDELDKVAGGDGVQWPPCTPGASSPCSSCIGTW